MKRGHIWRENIYRKRDKTWKGYITGVKTNLKRRHMSNEDKQKENIYRKSIFIRIYMEKVCIHIKKI